MMFKYTYFVFLYDNFLNLNSLNWKAGEYVSL